MHDQIATVESMPRGLNSTQTRDTARNLDRQLANRDIYAATWSLIEVEREEEEEKEKGGERMLGYRLMWQADKRMNYGNGLTDILRRLQLGQESRPTWGGKIRKMAVITHLPNMQRRTEKEMKDRKITKRKQEIGEAFFTKGSRHE